MSITEKIETDWDFVSAYYPNYHSSDYIAEFLDLEMEMNRQESPEPTEEMKLYHAQMLNKIYEESIEGYIESLKDIDPKKEIEQAKQVLKDAGFQVANLWSLPDVMDNYECSEEEAMNLLERTLTNDHIIESIWVSMDIIADINGIKRK